MCSGQRLFKTAFGEIRGAGDSNQPITIPDTNGDRAALSRFQLFRFSPINLHRAVVAAGGAEVPLLDALTLGKVLQSIAQG